MKDSAKRFEWALEEAVKHSNEEERRRLLLEAEDELNRPRPERPAFCQEFEKRIHGWDYRTLVRPGLSGPAQVMGGYDLLPKEKVVLDLWK